MADTEDVSRENQLINEEYKVWKKNTPFLYDLVVTETLEWPSLTVEWTPHFATHATKQTTQHRLLVGTHTSDEEPNNYVAIVDVTLPSGDATLDLKHFDDASGEMGGVGAGGASDIKTLVQIPHDGDVNRARWMPQAEYVFATRTTKGDVLLFDYSKFPSRPSSWQCVPTARLVGLKGEGAYGLSWNKQKPGLLLSCGEDKKVAMWDVSTGAASTFQAVKTFSHHSNSVCDVDWHKHHAHLFGSVGDDKLLCLWDTRKEAPVVSMVAHDSDINCLAFSPFSDFLVVTGSADNTVRLWDMRNLKSPLHTFDSHTDAVSQVQWSPHSEAILASCSNDRRVNVWDLSRIGEEQTAEDAEDGPPELLFIHGGHTSTVNDIAFCPNYEFVIASVGADNALQVWQMADNIYRDEEATDEARLE